MEKVSLYVGNLDFELHYLPWFRSPGCRTYLLRIDLIISSPSQSQLSPLVSCPKTYKPLILHANSFPLIYFL